MASYKRAAEQGVATRFFEFRTLWPFPEDEVREFIASAQHVFVVENNYTGQLERLVRYVVGPLERMHRAALILDHRQRGEQQPRDLQRATHARAQDKPRARARSQ